MQNKKKRKKKIEPTTYVKMGWKQLTDTTDAIYDTAHMNLAAANNTSSASSDSIKKLTTWALFAVGLIAVISFYSSM